MRLENIFHMPPRKDMYQGLRYLCFCEGKFWADFRRKMNRNQRWFLLILRLPSEIKNAWRTRTFNKIVMDSMIFETVMATQFRITIKMLFHFFTHSKKNTNQEAQLWLLVVLCYILLHRLFMNQIFCLYPTCMGVQFKLKHWNDLWIGFLKKGRTHLAMSVPKKTKRCEESSLLIFQSSSSKQSSTKNWIIWEFFDTNSSVVAKHSK